MPLVKTSYYSSLVQEALPQIKRGAVAYTQLDIEGASKLEAPLGVVLDLEVETYKIKQDAILVRLLFPETLPAKEIKFNTVYLLDTKGKVLFVDLLNITYTLFPKEEEEVFYLPTFSYLFKLTEIDVTSAIAKEGIFATYSDLNRHNDNPSSHPYILSRLPYYGEISTSNEPTKRGKLWITPDGIPYYFDGTDWVPLKAKYLVGLEDVSKIPLTNQNTTITAKWTFAVPFELDAAIQGQLITGLNADQVDGFEPSIAPGKGKIVGTTSDSSTIDEGWLPTTLSQDYTFNGQLTIGKPFVLADSVKGQLITGLNADQVDGLEPSATPDKGKIVSTSSDSSTIDEGWLPTTLSQDYTFNGRVTFTTPPKWPVKVLTEDYTAVNQDRVLLIDASNNAVTVTLPDLEEGTVLVIKRKDDSTNTVTLTGTIEGQENNSISLNPKEAVILVFSSGWWRIS
jgi:hypothetical protein